MPKRKGERVHPKIVKVIIPDLTPEERARRIENFFDIWARVTKAEGYTGCHYDNATNTIIKYWD